MSESFSSRWWYGVALLSVPLVNYVVQLSVFGVFLPPSGDLFRFLAAWLVVVLLWWLSVAIALVFAVSLFMDARAVRSSTLDWGPNQYLYGLVGLLHPIALVLLVPYAITIPVGLFYLYRRHQYVGTP